MYGGLFGDLPDTDDKGEAEKTAADGVAEQPPPKRSRVALQVPMFVPQQATRRRRQAASRPAPKQNFSMIPKQTGLPVANTSSLPRPSEATVVKAQASRSPSEGITESMVSPPFNATVSEIPKTQEKNLHHVVQSVGLVDSAHDELFQKAVEEAKLDPYDPMVPNDLLEYRKSQIMVKEKERLLREREEAIREQEIIRRRLDEERQQLERTGDIDRIVQHRVRNGMGRGERGVSNLPAWVIAKQKKEGGL